MPTNIDGFSVFGGIEEKWLSVGGPAGVLGHPVSNETSTFDDIGRFQNFQKGIVSWYPKIGSHIVWGLIGERWLQIGREQFGYPITDESSAPDGRGRFNHFRALKPDGTVIGESSIYWLPETGAHEVYGAIRDFWAKQGWETSKVGYPINAEHERVDGPGREQQFQHGRIIWSPASGAAFGDEEAAVFDTGSLTSNLPLGGSAHLVMRQNGTFTFTSHAHDSGFDNIDYALGAVFMTTSGIAFTFKHEGHVEGTTAGLPFGTPNRNDDFVMTGTNPSITKEWSNLAGGRFIGNLGGKDTLVGGIEGMIGDLVKTVAQDLGKAAAAAIIALL